ncbi:MAG TPA: hypothetical protein VNK91_02050 [Burkholderiaceae bacterium]|nr:hypothetical protein [Burkholderiaceae bacterium]
MSMGRPRDDGQKDLPPGLYIYAGRDAYIKLAGMKKAVTLDGIRERQRALEIYWAFRAKWDAAQTAAAAEQLLGKLETAASGGDVLTVAQYAKQWREERLPKLLAKRGGKALAPKTRDDYGRMLAHHVEAWEPFQTLAVGGLTTRHLRQYLARWIGSPNYYNYQKAVLSRLCQDLVAEGLLDANPIADVDRQATGRRMVYVPMDHYLAITDKLPEWLARACDLIYLISHRPSDVLRLKDEPPGIRYEGDDVVVSFMPTKNEQAVEIRDRIGTAGGIEATLAWFRQWKKDQGIVSPYFVVFPKGSRRRDVGRPINRDYLSRRFAEAAAAAGLAGRYQPRDLRKKGLTDEARLVGAATNKGGHKTEAMRQYYVVGGIPVRVRGNLTVLREQK